MIFYLLTLLILLSGSLLGAVRFQRRFEEILPLTCIGIVLILFLFGLMDHLLWGVYAVVAAVLGIYAYAAFLCLGSAPCRAGLVRNLLTPGLVIFLGFFCLFALCDFNRLASVWDEFSHWMYCVKTTTYLNDFSTNPAAYSGFPSYPPGMCLFQYFFQKLYQLAKPGMPFSEWRAYFAYHILMVAPAFPFFRKLSFRKPVSILLGGALLFVLPLTFYEQAYARIYIDVFLSMLAGFAFAAVLLDRDSDSLTALQLSAYCAMLVLSKDVGLFFACFAGIAYLAGRLCVLLSRENRPSFRPAALLPAGLPLASALVTKLLWKWEVVTSGCRVRFDGKIDFLQYTQMFFLKNDDTYRQESVNRFKEAFFTFCLPCRFEGITCFMVFCLLTLLLSLAAWRLISKDFPKSATIVTAVILFASVCVYVYSLGASYVYKFTQREALELASYDRYIWMPFLVLWVVIGMAAFWLISHRESEKQALLLSLCCLTVVAAITPLRQVFDYLTQETINTAYDTRSPFFPLAETIGEFCEEGDDVYLICQGFNDFAPLVIRTVAYPARYSSDLGPRFGSEADSTPNFAVSKVTAEEWRECLLSKYEYVAVFRTDDFFTDTYGVLFEDPSQIADDTLFRVDPERGLLIRCTPD